MNKKAIAIDVLKHPLIKKLLEMNIASPSIINRLIVEEIMESSQGSTLRDRFSRSKNKLSAKQALAVAEMDASEKGSEYTEEESAIVDDLESKQNEIVEFNATFQEFVKNAGNIGTYDHNKHLSLLQQFVAQFNNFRVDFFKAHSDVDFKDAEDEGPYKEAKVIVTQIYNEIDKKYNDFKDNPTIATEFFNSLKNNGDIGSAIEAMKDIQMNLDTAPTDPPEQAAAALGAPEQEIGTETPPEETTTEKVAGSEEAKTELSGESEAEADEMIKTQAETDIESNPEKEQEIKTAAEEIKADVDEMRGSEDEDDNVPKEEFANLFEKENDGNVPSLADAFDYFSDKFVSTRYMEEQRKAINDVFAALAAFREGMKGLKGSSLTPTDTVTEAVEPTEEITPEETSELKQKQQEMIQALKNMAALIKAGDKEEDLFSKSRKDRIKREAEALQILLMDVNALLVIETAPAPATPLQEVSRNEKIENIKKVYAAVNPVMLKVDEIVRNFKNPSERVNVSVSTINNALDKIENQLKTIQPYFGKRQTAFTKDKMSYKNLAGMVKRFAKQLAQIITEMNGAMKDGKITFKSSRSLADKMKEISEDIEKYIGAPSRLKVKAATDVEFEPEEEEEVEEETPEISKKDFVNKYSRVKGMLSEFLPRIKDLDEDKFYKLLKNYLEDAGKFLKEEKEGEEYSFEDDKLVAIEHIKIMNKAFETIRDSEDQKEINKQIKLFKQNYEGLKDIASSPLALSSEERRMNKIAKEIAKEKEIEIKKIFADEKPKTEKEAREALLGDSDLKAKATTEIRQDDLLSTPTALQAIDNLEGEHENATEYLIDKIVDVSWKDPAASVAPTELIKGKYYVVKEEFVEKIKQPEDSDPLILLQPKQGERYKIVNFRSYQGGIEEKASPKGYVIINNPINTRFANDTKNEVPAYDFALVMRLEKETAANREKREKFEKDPQAVMKSNPLPEQVQIKLERLIEMKLQDYISQDRNLKSVGTKAEDKLVIVDASMEERLIKRLAPLVEQTFKRKQHG